MQEDKTAWLWCREMSENGSFPRVFVYAGFGGQARIGLVGEGAAAF
jgi:hypothetical protein